MFVAGAAYQIWLRPVAAQAATPIPGTEGGTFPFWSPDSRFIGFFAGGKLKKVQIAGGPPIVLCDAPFGRGGSWSRDNVIVFAPSAGGGTGLSRVSSAGGTPAVVTTVDPGTGETNHRWPHFLPDGRHFFYTASTGACCPASQPATIRIGSLDPADATLTLLQAESSMSYASGHVLFARDGTLMAQAFDPDARQLTGDAFPVGDRVATEGSRYVSASVSENGTLVYARGGPPGAQRLTWFDRAGRVLGTLGEAPYIPRARGGRWVALSRDEKRVAITLETGSALNQDIWTIDVARNLRSRLTVDPDAEWSPVWSPDGTRIAFGSRRGEKGSLKQKSIAEASADEVVLEGEDLMTPSDWSADGRFIAYSVAKTFPVRSDVWVLPLFGDRKPFPVAQTAFNETSGVFSPDARWIAYTSDEAGQPNVYVQPLLGGGARQHVSRDGGGQAVWRADGRELFFITPDGTLMAAPIDASGEFNAEPQALFPAIPPSTLTITASQFAVTKDGQRFLVIARPDETSTAPLTVVVNWTAAIQK